VAEGNRILRKDEPDLFGTKPGKALITRLPHDRGAIMACEDNLAFMRPLPAGSIQLIVTSPPANWVDSVSDRHSREKRESIAQQPVIIGPGMNSDSLRF
jgi:hypothetical protein